ncbi:MAG: glycosyltransferase [Deltaproteobacteria bacterium]
MNLRTETIKIARWLFPFPLRADAQIPDSGGEVDISCVINFWGRAELLKGILHSLAGQDFPKERFEVLLVEDRGGTPEGAAEAQRFSSRLNVRYLRLQDNFGLMGWARNLGLVESRGRIILFLDDDTVILQPDFLSRLAREFESQRAEAIVPLGSASYSIIEGRYDFHDPYFPTNRCVAYRRDAIRELGGFVAEIIGQEDVEFVVRFVASGREFHKSSGLQYMHPPLVTGNIRKAAAVGYSFTRLRERYPLPIWLMLLANGLRFLPLYLAPTRKNRMQARFSLGFAVGIFYAITGRKIEYN